MAEIEPVSASSNNLSRAELRNTKHSTDRSSNVITTIGEKDISVYLPSERLEVQWKNTTAQKKNW